MGSSLPAEAGVIGVNPGSAIFVAILPITCESFAEGKTITAHGP